MAKTWAKFPSQRPATMAFVGLPLGAFVGILSGFLFMLILRDGFLSSGKKHVSRILGQLVALVSFALGGTWFANSSILKGVEPSELLEFYLVSFIVVFALVVAVPLYQLIVRIAAQFATIEQSIPVQAPHIANAPSQEDASDG